MSKKLVAAGLSALLLGCSTVRETNPGGAILGTVSGLLGTAVAGDYEKPSKYKKIQTKRERSENLFFEAGPIYRESLVNGVDSLPENIRDVPIHPNDLHYGIPGAIDDQPISLGPRIGGFFRFGPKFDLGDDVKLKFGIEGEFSGALKTDINERNYTNDPGTSQSGSGAALTYVTPYTHCGPNWNTFFIPKIFLGLEKNLSDSFKLGLGTNLWAETLSVETGWDRWQSYQKARDFELVNMLVGSAGASLEYRTSQFNSIGLNIGIQKILGKDYTEDGRQSKIDFRDNPLFFTIGGTTVF